ncbi:DUF502 domain-containing protein [Aquabacterium sp. A7-Y]|uniref:DUF502 domain-containing protein n=1 Tax=Aquabacterium sp. A7-Y TaxID=1349605 RepID=UPI00223D4DD6|nr:DUF502 domain-containing protein [Aquabacterium sp. A7-Y]MCW7539230.1 DUF502 domain-containing protein [Aquabacterium sp. A7-Y]
MKNRLRKLLRTFLTGLVAVLPLAVTMIMLAWVVQLLYGLIGPQSLVGRVLVLLGVGLVGSGAIAYLLGIAIVLLGVFGLGLLVEAGVQKGLRRALEAAVLRIPVVRTIYDVIKRLMALLTERNKDGGLGSMSPVWCHFGGRGGAAVLALLSTPQPVLLGDRSYLAVLVPTAPVPVGGGLIFVPAEWVEPADLGVEGVTSIYVSMGVSCPQYMPAAPRSTGTSLA